MQKKKRGCITKMPQQKGLKEPVRKEERKELLLWMGRGGGNRKPKVEWRNTFLQRHCLRKKGEGGPP